RKNRDPAFLLPSGYNDGLRWRKSSCRRGSCLMGRCRALACVAALAALLSSVVHAQTIRQSSETIAADEARLRKAGLGVDGPSLLKYFRDRTFPEADPARMTALLHRLGSDSFSDREKAFGDILSLGNSALFALRQAEGVPDAEVNRRVSE